MQAICRLCHVFSKLSGLFKSGFVVFEKTNIFAKQTKKEYARRFFGYFYIDYMKIKGKIEKNF